MRDARTHTNLALYIQLLSSLLLSLSHPLRIRDALPRVVEVRERAGTRRGKERKKKERGDETDPLVLRSGPPPLAAKQTCNHVPTVVVLSRLPPHRRAACFRTYYSLRYSYVSRDTQETRMEFGTCTIWNFRNYQLQCFRFYLLRRYFHRVMSLSLLFLYVYVLFYSHALDIFTRSAINGQAREFCRKLTDRPAID